MPGVPKLLIVPNGPNSVKVLWPDPATNTYTLQQKRERRRAGRLDDERYSTHSRNGTTASPSRRPRGICSFRLSNP